MNQYELSVSRVIDAPPAAVYAVFADYQQGHAAVLPKPGIQGFIEKLITPPISRKIYNEELDLLAKYVAQPRMA